MNTQPVKSTVTLTGENTAALRLGSYIKPKKLMQPTSLAVAWLLLLPLSAKCQCTGRSNEQIYSGGDKSPLTWSSLRNVSGQTVSYERAVENHTDQDITDIYWPVAGYARDLLPANTPICDQTTIPGETDTKKGPLNYGPGVSAVYQTASYCPKDGWPSGQLADLLPTTGVKEALSSAIQVAIRSAKGNIAICNLRLLSAFTQDYSKGTIKYQYELENDGPEDLRVFWDVPRTKQFDKQFPMSMYEPIVLASKKLNKITIDESTKPVATTSTIFVYNSDRKLVARSIVGVWGMVDGKTTTKLLKNGSPLKNELA